jgi:cell division protein FtsB
LGDAPQPGGGFISALKAPISAGVSGVQRLLAIGAVFGLLFLMYAGNVVTYFNYKAQIAQTRALIEQRTASLGELQLEIERWKDPNYLRAQARERLGWVIPGEIGFRVVGPDGQPLGGGAVVNRTGALPSDEHPEQWFERLLGSVLTADDMAPLNEGP